MISLFFLGFLLLTFAWNLYYAKHWNRSLFVTLRFLQDFVYAGEQAEMTEQIENRKKLVLPVLEVAFHVDKRLAFHNCENTSVSDYTYKRDIFALLGYQRVTRKLTLNCTKRGCYRIDKSYLTAFSMLHRRRFSIDAPADTQLYVYAARTNVSDILVTCERLMGSVQCAKRLFEDPFAYASIREYTVTDPMKTINWKASARTGELMVNTFESTHMEKVLLILDVEDSGILKYEYLTEDAISVAATLAQKMIARGMEVGLCTNIVAAPDSGSSSRTAFTCLPPSSGKKQLTDIERLLAIHKSDAKVLPLPDMLDDFASKYEKNTYGNSSAHSAALSVHAPRSSSACVHPITCDHFSQNVCVRDDMGHKYEKNTYGNSSAHSAALSVHAPRSSSACVHPITCDHFSQNVCVRDDMGHKYADQAEDAILIFISKNAVQNQSAIEAFADRQQAVWVVPCPRNEACAVHTAENIRLISREVNDF